VRSVGNPTSCGSVDRGRGTRRTIEAEAEGVEPWRSRDRGGGPQFTFSDGFSLFVECEDQKEVDEYWDKLVKAGATEARCGWIKDPFGLSWQIVPRRFIELIRDDDPRKVKAVVDAMMKMARLDVETLERAYQSAT
jgi:predicted 3-demethylubiquinone-9 3-methyltransferase (glyoxalase superfamily)